MRVLLRKSVADLTRRQWRTFLMIVGIFVGVVGVTAVNEANVLIGGAFFYNNDATVVPNVSFTVATLPPAVATAIQYMPDIQRFQLRTLYNNATWDLAHGAGSASIQIAADADPLHAQIYPFQIVTGRLPGSSEIALDVSDQAIQSIALGDTVQIETLGGQAIPLRVVGLVRTRGLAVRHPQVQAVGYMSLEGIQQFAPTVSEHNGVPGEKGPPLVYGTQILIRTHDIGSVRQTYDAVQQTLTAAHSVPLDAFWWYADADADNQLAVSGLATIIEIGALIALVLVVVLIFNTISTLITEQTAVIGTMKAIGGTRWQIIRSYSLSVGIVSVIATVLGLNLGLIVGYQLAAKLAATVQQDVGPFAVASWVIAVGLAVGIVTPLLAALVPLLAGTRVTVREALAAYGVRANGGMPRHAWGRRFGWVSQTTWLGLRGLFRRPGRTALTLFALTLASTIFMAVQITNTSLDGTFAEHTDLASFHSDFFIRPNDTIPSTPLVTAFQALPNVKRVEAIDPAIVTIAHGEISLQGLPADTQLFRPDLIAGRWLQNEMGTIVINDYAAQRLNLHVGETVTVQFFTQPNSTSPANEAQWRIVGIVHDIEEVDGSANPQGRQGQAFTTLANLNVLRNLPADDAERLWLSARDHTPRALAQLRAQIQQTLVNLGQGQNLDVESRAERFDATNPFPIVATIFDAMVLLVAVVGLLGLVHSLTASVLERRLEIGILRSLGAPSWRVGMVFLVEGLALAGIAWAVGALIGVPAGLALLQLLAVYLGPFDIFFQPSFIPITLLLVVVVTTIASMGPVLSAARVRVRDSLRYE